MNYTILLFMLNLVLLARLRLIFRDEGATTKDVIVMVVLPLLILPFLEVNMSWFLLLLWFLVLFPLIRYSENASRSLYRNRFLMLLLQVLVLGIFCSPLFNLTANAGPGHMLEFINRVILPDSILTTREITNGQLLLFGLLMVINEMNILLRYLLQSINLESLGSDEKFNEGEYNTGRLIGMLERIFVFLFVLLNQYTAIGFILAAKGVARFPDFKIRTFAEYVLIGTLLSALLAFSVAYFVNLLL